MDVAQLHEELRLNAIELRAQAAERDRIGVELVAVTAPHGLVTHEILGHLIRLQARSALADFAGAQEHADAADQLAKRHERPLVAVFTHWFQALRIAASEQSQQALQRAEEAYRKAATHLHGAGMPGVERGLLALALLCLRVWHGQPIVVDDTTDWGPYTPWARPLLLLARGRKTDAADALRRIPDPPPDLLMEALWCLTAHAAITIDDRATMQRAYTALAPAAGELAGAASGMITAGPVALYLNRLTAATRGAWNLR